MLRKTMAATALLVLFCGISSANTFDPANIDWFDLSAWDHSTVTGTGQVFNDVCGDLDLIAAGIGNSFTTSFVGDDILIGGNSDLLSLAFNLSEPTDVVIEFNTIDPEEILTFATLFSPGTPAYVHGSGLLPNISSDFDISGNGFGLSPNGVSSGFVIIQGATSFGINYEALANQKFDGISIGKINTVPEPGAFALLLPGFLAGLCFRRKRQ